MHVRLARRPAGCCRLRGSAAARCQILVAASAAAAAAAAIGCGCRSHEGWRNFRHSCCHGLGRRIVDAPWLNLHLCWSQALDRAFATAMPLLFAMWTHAQRTVDAGGTAALVLETLACLHFARMQHGLYSDLVQVRSATWRAYPTTSLPSFLVAPDLANAIVEGACGQTLAATSTSDCVFPAVRECSSVLLVCGRAF